MHYSFFAPDWKTNRELFRPKRLHLVSPEDAGEKHVVLFHGWHSLYQPLTGLENTLRALPEAHNTRFWRATFDSHWKTFGQSAREVMRHLRRMKVQPENTILIGYSMGGLVARAMVANGFNARGVICLCTPHRGAARWMPVGDIGSLSMARWSKRLARLNANPRDKARRDDYHFYAVTYSDALGFHAHDRIVGQRSALGEGLEGVATHHTIHVRYPGIAPGCAPHLCGMSPHHMAPAIETCRKMLRSLDVAPSRAE